jgi:hypothetical protein
MNSGLNDDRNENDSHVQGEQGGRGVFFYLHCGLKISARNSQPSAGSYSHVVALYYQGQGILNFCR